MIPSSTKSCSAVVAFPEVCKTPTPGGPVPTPYPNIARGASTATASKTTPAGLPTVMKTGVNFSTSTGDEAGSGSGLVSSKVKGVQSFKIFSTQTSNVGGVYRHVGMTTAAGSAHLLRNKLNHLNQQLTSLSGRNPELWHSLVDEYVQVTANLYMTLAESNQH